MIGTKVDNGINIITIRSFDQGSDLVTWSLLYSDTLSR